jgi:hypothetical protein
MVVLDRDPLLPVLPRVGSALFFRRPVSGLSEVRTPSKGSSKPLNPWS